MAFAKKSIKQRFHPSTRLLSLMEDFRQMTNDCIRLGMEFEKEYRRTPSRNKLSLLSYRELRKRRRAGYSGYLLCANTKAAGILSARRKSIRRGFATRTPYLSRRVLVSCYGFKIEDGKLIIHLDAKTLESIPLNSHTKSVLSDPVMRVRSFTLTEESVSLCVSKNVKEIMNREVASAIGIDRNVSNLTVGNAQIVKYYDMKDVVDIGEKTRDVVRSFKRADVRIRKEISSRYGKRRSERTRQLLNLISKNVVKDAKTNRQAIIFEEIAGIRKLYRRGNGQGRPFRARMNSWPFYEIKRQIEYKAAWEGVPVITLNSGETRGTTMDCPQCGERLQVPIRSDEEHHRQLWCKGCKRWRNRDLVAVLNISRRGWLRFDHSSKEGEAGEAVKGNLEDEGEPVILRVDVSKLRRATAQQTQ